MGKDINESKLIGGKRKNGHKLNCTCHICENMKNKARRGGYEEDIEKEQEKMMGGSKKKNGHRKDCKCPICKNMNKSKKRGGSKSSGRTKKRRGGDDNDGYEEEKTETDEEKEEMEPYDNTSDEEVKEEEKKGGKKKRGNGHKSNCKCPICKNMRKKKGGDEPDEENQMGDIEEGGIKATDAPASESETKASEDDYDALDAAEKGEAGQNVVGGSRKKRRGKTCGGKKWGGKTKKARKHH